jgi:hypothetical protein
MVEEGLKCSQLAIETDGRLGHPALLMLLDQKRVDLAEVPRTESLAELSEVLAVSSESVRSDVRFDPGLEFFDSLLPR